MLRKFWQSALGWLRRAISQPREELDRWQATARFVYDLLRYGAWQLRHDRASQMAAALAFRSLFALVPVLIVAMIVVNSVHGVDGFSNIVEQISKSLQLDEVRIAESGDMSGDVNAESQSLADWLEGLVSEAANANLTAAGWFGFALIAYAALGLMMTIESTFNTIYRAPQGRPWLRSLPLYWFILTLGPIALMAVWFADAKVATWMEAAPVGQGVLAVARVMWGFGKDWFIFLMIYTLLPNTTVRFRPAAAGALVAALLFAVGEQTLGIYLRNAFRVNQLYGSLGLVPVFMLWSYFIWMFVLFGLQVSATLQALRGRQLDQIKAEPSETTFRDPAVIVTVMEVVAEDFAAGRHSTVVSVAELCALPTTAVAVIFQRLVDRNLLHWVDGADNCVCIARAPDTITAAELMDVGFQLVDDNRRGRRSDLVDRLRDAQRSLAERQTLAALVS